MEDNKYIAVIPTYQPNESLIEIVNQLYENNFDIIVVNDGSGHRFLSIFMEIQQYCTLLKHNENKGKGAALKTAFQYIKDTNITNRIVITVDGDGQHAINDIIATANCANEKPDSLILGSRQFHGNVPKRSQFGNTLTRYIFTLSTRQKVYDTQTGLRAFHTSFIDTLLEIPGERYEYEMNMLLQFSKMNIPVHEHTIETIYINDNESSHFNTIIDSLRIYKEIIKFSFSSICSFLIDFMMFTFLYGVTGILSLSNVVARIISASFNFTMNRKFVFQSEQKIIPSLLQYSALCIVIMIGNTLVLEMLSYLNINVYISKIITEVLFFLLSLFVQKKFIFSSQRKVQVNA